MASLSIHAFYRYALAEGEGVGTAYEYFAKRRVMEPVLARVPAYPTALIAGLPQKYGCSLDLVLAAWELGAELRVADERPEALEKLQKTIAACQADGLLGRLKVEYKQLKAMEEVASFKPVDVVMSSEVVQRVAPEAKAAYAGALMALAPHGMVFVPNSVNSAHLVHSGLGGATPDELRQLFPRAHVRLVDMPPFPPGITRSESQRAQASSGLAERLAMKGLELYSQMERVLPAAVSAQVAHITCGVWG